MSLSGLGASRRMSDVVKVRRGMGVKAARRESVSMDLRRTIVGGDIEGECVLVEALVLDSLQKS